MDSPYQGLNPTLCCEGLLQNLAMLYQHVSTPWNHILNAPCHDGFCLYDAMTSTLLMMNIYTSVLGLELMGNVTELCKEPNLTPQDIKICYILDKWMHY
jgi:hypothetical protein